jgi:hypothetical protein
VKIIRDNFCATACYDILRFSPNNAISDLYTDGKQLIRKSVGYVPFNFNRPCLIEVKQSSLPPSSHYQTDFTRATRHSIFLKKQEDKLIPGSRFAFIFTRKGGAMGDA